MRCRRCGLSRDGAHNTTVEQCSAYLAREGRGPCEHPRDHHRFRPDWGWYFRDLWAAIAALWR